MSQLTHARLLGIHDVNMRVDISLYKLFRESPGEINLHTAAELLVWDLMPQGGLLLLIPTKTSIISFPENDNDSLLH
jgi:hypothetical protein